MKDRHISISPGNTKMGDIPSVSLPVGLTCRPCACIHKCYAKKLANLRPNVRNAYQYNLMMLFEEPDIYWREVEAAIMMNRYFRFHVSGDIPNADYFLHMIQIAERNQHCEILCFTKKYDIVNNYLDAGQQIPANLHVLLSAWAGLQMENPHRLPEAHVRYRDNTTTARPDAIRCGGNCAECALTDCGCWTLKPGEQVVFNEH